jgi:PAS domain S-box-containing protein
MTRTNRTPRRPDRWTQFIRFLSTPIPAGTESRRWIWGGVWAALFAASIPLSDVVPMAGHLLFLAQFIAILLLAARAGWRGAWAGYLLTVYGSFASFATTFVVTLSTSFLPLDMAYLAGAGLLFTLATGYVAAAGERSRALMEQVGLAERRLATLINAMPTGFVLVDGTGQIVFSNREARRLLHNEAPEEFGISLRDLVCAESWPELSRRIGRRTVEEPFRVSLPGATPLRTEWVFAPFHDDGATRTIGFFWDAEEKIRREEESRALMAALRCLQEGVVLAHLDGTIRYANPAAAQIYGYADRREMVGRELREHVAPRDLGGFNERMERARTTGGTCEIRLARPDGGETEVHVTTSPVQVDGAVIGTIGVIRDLTESKVIARRATAADKQAALGRLVAGAAHEINNPLTAILGSITLLRGESLGGHIDRHLQVIEGECLRAGRIVRDLLAFARQRPVSRATLELADVVREAVALRASYARTAGIELTLHTPSAAPVSADADQVTQVVLNLLSNAEDAVAGSNVRRISVTIGRRADRALLLVNDSGPGVADELQQQVFEPFFTTKAEGHGTGLGLSVSAGIVSEHGGKISVTRGVLGGAQFAVEFPLAESAAPALPATAPAAPPRRSATRLRILMVDDEPAILGSIGRVLQRLGHEVRVAQTGADGLALALSESFDVVISDLRMPGMSGRELHARLTEEGILPGADFIVATGDSADPEAFAFLQATGLPVLLKPFEIRQLVELLARCRPQEREVLAAVS